MVVNSNIENSNNESVTPKNTNNTEERVQRVLQNNGSVYMFVDDSGSTNYSRNYWNTATELIKQYKQWSQQYREKKASQFHEYYWSNTLRMTKGEFQGTDTSIIAQHLKTFNPKNDLIIIITDGQIDQNELNKTHSIMSERKSEDESFAIGMLDFYIIEDSEIPNSLSVIAPFSSFTTSALLVNTKTKTNLLLSTKQSLTDLVELIQSCNTHAEYMKNYNTIRDTIMSFSLGMKDLQFLIPIIRTQTEVITNSLKKELCVDQFNAETATDEEVMNEWQKITFKPSEFESMTCKLIQLCRTRTLNYQAFSANQLHTATDIDDSDSSDQIINKVDDDTSYECPISMDFGCPGIMLYLPDNVENMTTYLTSLDSKFCNNCVFNPFLLLSNQYNDKIQFSNLVGRSMSLTTYFDLQKNNDSICPFTRKKIAAFLVLSNTKEAKKFNNWQIRSWLYNKKKIGYPAIVTLLIYWIGKEKEYLRDVIDSLYEHTKFRIETGQSSISISGLLADPQFKCSIKRALRFCLNTDRFLRRFTSQQFDAYSHFAELTNDENTYNANRFQVVMQFQKFIHSNHKNVTIIVTETEKPKNKKLTIQFTEHDGSISTTSVLVDGEGEDDCNDSNIEDEINENDMNDIYEQVFLKYYSDNRINYKKISKIDSVPLPPLISIYESTKVKKSKNGQTVPIPIYNYPLKSLEELRKRPITFNTKTFRPSYYIEVNGQKIVATEYYRTLFPKKIVSVTQQFLSLLSKFKRLPTKKELCDKLMRKHRVLPRCVFEYFIDEVVDAFYVAISKSPELTIEQIIKKVNDSERIVDRIRIEGEEDV